MAALRPIHLAIALAAPLLAIAAVALLRGPEADEPIAAEPDGGAPTPASATAKPVAGIGSAAALADADRYPLAAAFVPAHRANYEWGEMGAAKYIVVHTIEGSYFGAQRWFRDPRAQVSAQFCVRSRDGEVTQMLSLHDKAWHVGAQNGEAIGIEHEGFVDHPAWYTEAAYRGSARLARWLAERHAIPLDRAHILGHEELPGQTHEDPGPGWDWPLYMALIEGVVPAERVEGWVVDRRAGCALTTTRATWLRRGLAPADELLRAGDPELCWLPAGAELPYLHAAPLADLLELRFDPDAGPCAGLFGLAGHGYIPAADVEADCTAKQVAVADATVILDGGPRVQSDGEGRFSFVEVAPGPHTLEVHAGLDYAAALELVELDGYPGLRVLLPLDPRPDRPLAHRWLDP